MVLNAVNMAKTFINKVVKPGDAVVDATVGNGKDTLFLASLVGDKGLVYGFDIQQKALDSASNLLRTQGVLGRVKLIKDGHQNMDVYVNKPVKAVMFNLGYLPGGDHSIITLPETTIAALRKSLELLLPGGIITVVAYCGHPGGMDEKHRIVREIQKLDPAVYKCAIVEAANQHNNPPVLIVIEKRSNAV